MRSLAVTLAMGLVALLQLTPVSDNDLWWLLKTGERMVTTHTFPTADPFTWTAEGTPWVNHTWGFELLLYGVYALAGFSGLIALQMLFALATFGVMYWTLRRGAVPAPWAVGLIAITALVTRGFWSPRPQLVTYLGLAIFWAIVWEYREGRSDRLWWLPALTVLWVNLHGGFFIGLAVLGFATAGQAADRLFDIGEGAPPSGGGGRMAKVWLACVGAALLNPFHVRALLFPLHVSGDREAKDFIIEWSSPAFQTYPELRMFESVLLFFLAVSPAVRWRPRLADVALLVTFVHLTLDATRNIPLFMIVLTPLAGRLGVMVWARLREHLGDGARLVRRRTWAAACLAVLVAFVWFRETAVRVAPTLVPRGGVTENFPARAADFMLANRVPGKIFNDYGWGGYLIWRLFPDYRMFIDGRIALFPKDIRDDFLKINNVQVGWQDALDRRDIGLVFIRRDTPLSTFLRDVPGWVVLYEDAQAVIFHRRSAPQT